MLLKARIDGVLLWNDKNEPAAQSEAVGQQVLQSGLMQLLPQLLKAAELLVQAGLDGAMKHHHHHHHHTQHEASAAAAAEQQQWQTPAVDDGLINQSAQTTAY
jgi:hypothetical protein